MFRRSERDHLDATYDRPIDDLERWDNGRRHTWLRLAVAPLGLLWWVAGAMVVADLVHRAPSPRVLLVLAVATAVGGLVLLVRSFRAPRWDPLDYLLPSLVIAAIAGVGILSFLDHPPVAIAVLLVVYFMRRDR